MNIHNDPRFTINATRYQQLLDWARIARSERDDAAVQKYLNDQLVKSVAQMFDEIPALAEVEATTYGLDIEARPAPMREDVAEDWDDIQAIFAAAPRTLHYHGATYFVVPAEADE
jgi:Asp-tRNA(Asn)/Glu-tRNA(Gln) amidotransferase C subunit